MITFPLLSSVVLYILEKNPRKDEGININEISKYLIQVANDKRVKFYKSLQFTLNKLIMFGKVIKLNGEKSRDEILYKLGSSTDAANAATGANQYNLRIACIDKSGKTLFVFNNAMEAADLLGLVSIPFIMPQWLFRRL